MQRRNLVLRRMAALGSVDEAAFREAVAAPITADVFQRGIDLAAPYPAEWVRQQLIERYGSDIYTGFIVHTTLDSKRQAVAQRAVRQGLLDYDVRHGYRGAEGRLPATTDREAVVEALGAYSVSGGLEAAVVVTVDEQSVDVMLGNGETVHIDWPGLRWAPYLDSDRRGPTPRRAGEIVSVGDVIRVLRDEEGTWRLRQLPDIQAALVALDPSSGAVEALVGGWDFQVTQFNHAVQGGRQPGSGFKPFVYSAALENGITPASVFLNAPLVFEDDNLEMAYRPRNDSGEFSGPMRLREALAQSINMVSMRVMTSIGARAVLDHVGNFGFETANLPRDGATRHRRRNHAVHSHRHGPCLRRHRQRRVPRGAPRREPRGTPRRFPWSSRRGIPRPAVRARCRKTHRLRRFPPRAAVDQANAFVMDTLLRDVITHPRGTGRRARELQRPDLAGKTGTSDQATDTWFNGYHPNLAATVWVGFSDHRPTGGSEYGSRTPLTIWMEFMREALAGEPVVERPLPDGVVRVKINEETGRVALPDDPNALFEYFPADNLPERAPRRAGSETRESVRPEDIF